MEPFPQRIKRAFKPTPLDKAPYGVLCEVEDGSFYLQIGLLEEYPQWYAMRNEQDALDRQEELLKNQQ